jgi:hypothetical protein
MGTAGTHAKVRYRCFLPDLAGFTSPRRPDHKLLLQSSLSSGEGGIRTHDTLSDMHAFQACAFNRSATSPASGERRIRTYGTVSGTPDFESGAFDHSASSPAIQFSTFLAPQTLEEPGQAFRALGLEHAPPDDEPVIVGQGVQVE